MILQHVKQITLRPSHKTMLPKPHLATACTEQEARNTACTLLQPLSTLQPPCHPISDRRPGWVLGQVQTWAPKYASGSAEHAQSPPRGHSHPPSDEVRVATAPPSHLLVRASGSQPFKNPFYTKNVPCFLSFYDKTTRKLCAQQIQNMSLTLLPRPVSGAHTV